MTRTYSFKPALLRGAVTYEITEHALIRHSHPPDSITWAEVDRAAQVDQFAYGGIRARRLDLIRADGSRFSVACSSPKALVSANADGSTHMRLMAAIADRLATLRDGFPVAIGEHGRTRWIIFFIGILALLGAIGMVGLALATGVSSDRLIGAAFPMLVLGGFGAVLIYSYAPNRPVPQIEAQTLAQILRLRTEETPPAQDA